MKTLVKLLSLLIIPLLLVADSSVICFYAGNGSVYTTNVIQPEAYNNQIIYLLIINYFRHHFIFNVASVYSTSYYSTSNNVSINIISNISYLFYLSDSNNVYTINSTAFKVDVPKNSVFYVVPIAYIISAYNSSQLAYSNISLVFIGKKVHNFPLISNGKINNTTFHFNLQNNFYSVNVSWSLSSSLPPGSYYASILMLTVVSINGVYYCYFWNVSITSNLIPDPPISAPLVKYQLYNMSSIEIAQILNSLNS